MPHIISTDIEGDAIAVIIHKDEAGVVAWGRIYAYSTEAEAAARVDPPSHHVGDWAGTAANNVKGKGLIAKEHQGKYLMLEQRSGRVTWSTTPYRAGIGVEP